MEQNNLEKIKQEIDNYEDLKPYKLDIEVIENHSGKIMNLIKDNNDFSYPLKNKYYSFKFTEPIYIHRVTLKTEESVSLKGMEFVSIDYLDNENIMKFSKKDSISWLPRKVIKEFKIKPPSDFFNKKVVLTNIDMLGFQLDELNAFKEKVDEVGNAKSVLNDLLEEIENKNKELEENLFEKNEVIKNRQEAIDSLNSDIENLEDAISSLEDSQSSLEDMTNQLTIKKDSLSSETTNLENNIKQLEESSSQLNTKISNQTDELKELSERKGIFETVMSEYIEQGNKDIKLYTWLSVIPWVLIAIVSGLVFWGASDLTTVFETKENVDITSIFWSRVPFVIIVISILFVSFEISKMFIKNIIHIHKQKRIFTKIGMIARDVAEQSILGLDIEEKDKFELRTKLKMDLLKSHLKNEIGEDYEYEIKTSLLEHIKDIKVNKVKTHSKE